MPTKTTGPSENRAYPEADNTAPGGMSEKRLIAELVERHGWTKADAKALKWPEKIDAVIAERKNREAEKADQIAEFEEEFDDLDSLLDNLDDDEEADPEPDPEPEPVEEPDGTEPLDVDSMFLEISAAQEEMLAEQKANSIFLGMPGTYDYVFDGHAGASPSAAERWLTCTASLQASREFLETLTPNQQQAFAQGGDAAMEGTTAHAAGEVELLALLGRITEEQRDATLLELAVEPKDQHAYDDEMGDFVKEYTDLVAGYMADRGEDALLIEQRLEAVIPLTGLHEGGVHVVPGSGDTVVLPTEDEPTLVVIDLKYGEGVDVSPEGNPQLRFYGVGALGLLIDDDGNLKVDVEQVVYHIVQPRNGGIKTWSEPLSDLLNWRDEVAGPATTAALYGEGSEFVPTDKGCQWCPAKGACPALAKSRLDAATELFDVVQETEFSEGVGSLPDATIMDGQTLASLYTQVKSVVKLEEALKSEVNRRLQRGEEVPGYHLVNYQPPRIWSEQAKVALDPENIDNEHDEHGITTVQAEMLWKRQMVTPTQALTLLKKEAKVADPDAVIGEFIVQPEKKPVAAPVDDKRKAWEGVPPEQMFKVESDAEEVEE